MVETGREFDARMTFEAFVVGPANRLAVAAARRAAESPGTSYNPLFFYSASGLGKSHLLSAIAQLSHRQDASRVVVYQTLEGYLDELTRALEQGGQSSARDGYSHLDILLLDDVQFLTGQAQAQEMLLRTLDRLTARGAQVVLASDRPPAEINDLDARLLSRFSGGLIVDIGPPDYETRVAIMRRKAEERGVKLSPGVAEGMARVPSRNVRELQGALNRILAVQELEGRPVTEGELAGILGGLAGASESGRMESREAEADGAGAVGGTVQTHDEEPRWRRDVRETVKASITEGFRADRVLRLLDRWEEPEGWQDTLESFRADVAKLRNIVIEFDALGGARPESVAGVLVDPDRLAEAEALLASERERAKPFLPLPDGPKLEDLDGRYPALALRSAGRFVLEGRPDYNPLFIHSPDPESALPFLEALGRSFLASSPQGKVGFASVSDFSEEFIRAISDGVAGAWRERWWAVDLLILHGVEQLSTAERAQEEIFHLFEALKQRDARIVLTADRSPPKIAGIDDRLRSRFEGGLVVELGRLQSAPEPDHSASESYDDDLHALRDLAGLGREGRQHARGAARPDDDLVVVSRPPANAPSDWFPSRDKVVWDWPSLDERLRDEENGNGH